MTRFIKLLVPGAVILSAAWIVISSTEVEEQIWSDTSGNVRPVVEISASAAVEQTGSFSEASVRQPANQMQHASVSERTSSSLSGGAQNDRAGDVLIESNAANTILAAKTGLPTASDPLGELNVTAKQNVTPGQKAVQLREALSAVNDASSYPQESTSREKEEDPGSSTADNSFFVAAVFENSNSNETGSGFGRTAENSLQVAQAEVEFDSNNAQIFDNNSTQINVAATPERRDHIADKRPTIRKLPKVLVPGAKLSKISIASPADGSYTNSANILVSGSVVADKNLDSVSVNSTTVSGSSGAFTTNIPLQEGYNNITAKADYGRRTHAASVGVTLDTVRPSAISAVSASYNAVVLQFNEPMSDASILSTSNFNIIDDQTLTNLPVLAASFVDPSRTAVLLETAVQYSARFTLTIVNVKDLAGNTILEPQPLVPFHPAIVYFTGTSPSGEGLIDSDGDGLDDHVESAGWVVMVEQVNGATRTYSVYSDPYLPDTDGDGVGDADEFHGSMNPRSFDTDGDTLTDDEEWNSIYSNPSDQDTDDDGIEDGFEYHFFKTSPVFADTDGDQLSDPDEIQAANRNPLIADLPSPRISVGSINMQLDTRFTFTNEAGVKVSESKTSEATLTKSENDKFSNSNETSNKNTIETSQELSVTARSGGESGGPFPSYEGTATVGSKQGSERGSTVSVGEESGRSAEEAYHDSLTTSTEKDERETITREVVDAAIKVDLTIENDGDIPFTISNLELTAQTQNPNNRREIIPVASLVPENENLGSVNIGALGDPSRGPFVFKTVSIFPRQVEELMKSPRGFVVQLANFDIIDQEGNNFAFTSQQVLDRTVGITFDEGIGQSESFRVATASFQDPNTGKPNGITMARALEVIGLSRYPTIRDGGNGLVETTFVGDDEQAVHLSIFRPVEPNGVIVEAGANGTIETVPGGDDIRVAASYETALHRPSPFIQDGGNGIAETTLLGDDEALSVFGTAVQSGQPLIRTGDNGDIDSVPGGDDILVPQGRLREVLVRYKDTSASATERRFWALFTNQERPGVNLDEYQVRAGDQFDFAYVQDKDEDGVWAREEFLHGSSDLLINTDGCDLITPPDPCDTLLDAREIQEGWRVQLRSSPQGYRVYSNPNQADSDRDRLLDHEEFACELDPRLRDTDLDGLTDWEELLGLRILDGGNVVPMVSRDPSTNEIEYAVIPYSGAKVELCGEQDIPCSRPLKIHESFPACDALAVTSAGFATDPLDADTDGDLVNDLLELQLGLNPNDSSDGPLFLDDDGDGVPNQTEEVGVDAIINGVVVRITSNPNDPDTDDDGLPDLLEHFIRSNPRSLDTDGDTLSDANEYKNSGEACVTTTPGVLCTKFKDLLEDNFQTFVSECDQADVCNLAAFEANLITIAAAQLGTNLSEADSDFDSVNDNIEIADREITINGSIVPVTSDPLDVNSDNDLWDDGREFTEGTDPLEEDTDDDDTNDNAEQVFGRDPTFADKKVTVTSSTINVTKSDDEGANNDADLEYEADVSIDGGAFARVCTRTEISKPTGSFNFACDYFSRVLRNDPTSSVEIRFTGREDDTTDDEECSFTPATITFTYSDPIVSTSTSAVCGDDLNFTVPLDILEQ